MAEYVMEYDGWAEGIPVGEYLKVRDAMHARKREEVVRCRDCEHYVADPEPIDPGWPMMCDESGRDMLEPDGFCAWGKRKEGE